MTGFCMSGTATRVRSRFQCRVRVRSPSTQHYNKTASFITRQDKSSSENFDDDIKDFSFNTCFPESEFGNRVMVVIDSTSEAKGALEWALSHTLQNQDTIILFHLAKQDGKGGGGEMDQRGYDLLRSTKSMCQLKRPEVQVEMGIGEGKEKGATIVEEAKRLKASLLVLGHRKQSFVKRVQMIWGSKTKRRVVDYCIQNAHCMTIAVRRKNRKYGGYLITTKRHKKFWLLA